jgi:hypothetical protein
MNRFKNDNMRATVGKQTVCIYKILNGQAIEFKNFKTSDEIGIKNVLSLLTC